MRGIERLAQVWGFVKTVGGFFPEEGSDRYYGYAAERDGLGDEPDIDTSTPEGQEAWRNWERGRVPRIQNTTHGV